MVGTSANSRAFRLIIQDLRIAGASWIPASRDCRNKEERILMKMRKLFAGIAAAATLLGGMALGAASAQADDTPTTVTRDATFTFTAETAEQLTNAKLKAYKIGDYVQYGSGENVAYGVVTNSNNKTAVDSALKAAGVDTTDSEVDHLAAALNAGTLDVSAARPWDKNAAGGASTTRAFANALEKEKLANGTTVKFAATSGSAEDGYSATVTLPAGIYVFIDSAAATESVTKAIPMIVASGTVNTKKKALTDPIQGANTVNMKNTNNPGKTKEVNNTSAAIGDTLTYTLTGTIANPAPTEFKFTDKPGKGLTIKAGTFNFYVDGAQISAETAASDFTVPTADVIGGDDASFDVTVNNPSKYAGKTIKVTFQAVINDEADAENGVVNKLDNYGTDVEAPRVAPVFGAVCGAVLGIVHMDIQGAVVAPYGIDGSGFEAQGFHGLPHHAEGNGIGKVQITVQIGVW